MVKYEFLTFREENGLPGCDFDNCDVARAGSEATGQRNGTDGVRPMTAVRTTAITGAIIAVAFAVSISGSAMAGEKEQDQTAGMTPPPVVAAPADARSPATTASIYALMVYLQWLKCKDGNLLPLCP